MARKESGRRKVATTFTPRQWWEASNAELLMSMSSPVGKFSERFPLKGEVEETDMDGRTFLKRTRWAYGSVLESISREVTGVMQNVVATRWHETAIADCGQLLPELMRPAGEASRIEAGDFIVAPAYLE